MRQKLSYLLQQRELCSKVRGQKNKNKTSVSSSEPKENQSVLVTGNCRRVENHRTSSSSKFFSLEEPILMCIFVAT